MPTNLQLKGGSELQRDYLQKYVDIGNSVIHMIPNRFSKNKYHINNIDQKQNNIIWVHQSYDTAESMEVLHKYDQVDKVVFVSNWQLRKYVDVLGCPEDKSVVIENGIVPHKKHVKPKNIINLAYTSTPYRGLDILLQGFDCITDLNVHLHVFSSMEIYGQEENLNFDRLYKICKNHPKITYYGSVPHDDVKDFLNQVHILSYPSTFEETSCLSAIEAMSAECEVVCSNLGALPETTSRFANMYNFTKDNSQHVKMFALHLRKSVINYNQENFNFQKSFIDKYYSWEYNISNKWKDLLQSIDKKNTAHLNYD